MDLMALSLFSSDHFSDLQDPLPTQLYSSQMKKRWWYLEQVIVTYDTNKVKVPQMPGRQ